MGNVKEDVKIIRELIAGDEEDQREAFEYIECYPIVQSEFEEGGRWSNFETEVYMLESEEETAYFKVVREVPATEVQEGMDLDFEVHEVYPVERTIIVYE